MHHKLKRFVGSFLIVASIVVLLGWIGQTDPDCYYEMDLFVQYRMCEVPLDEVDKKEYALVLPVAGLSLLIIGLIVLNLSAKSKENNE